MRGQLTEKADVFSFGIVALEIVSGRNNFNIRLAPEKAYLLDWVCFFNDTHHTFALLLPSPGFDPQRHHFQDIVSREGQVSECNALSVLDVAPQQSLLVEKIALLACPKKT